MGTFTMEEKKRKRLITKALQGAAKEVVDRFGSAVKEHIVSFSGRDNENETISKRSLKSISKSKVNPEYKKQNLKQQAGFSAEVKAAARDSAEAIINHSDIKTVRTDDLQKQTDMKGRSVGGTNDQLFDLVETDPSGIIVEGSARQVKFIGGTAEECANKLLNKKYDKYRDNDVPIEVPSDFFSEVKNQLETEKKKLDDEIRDARQKKDIDRIKQLKNKRLKVEKTEKNLRQSSVSNADAMEARIHPGVSVAKDVAKVANRAGMEQAKVGAIISGSISIVKNVVACMKGTKEPLDAAKSVAKDIGAGAAVSYVSAFSGSVIKGAMQNATSSYVRGLSRTNLAAGLVTTAKDIAITMSRYIKGEITGVQCVEELGEQGFGEIGAAMFSTIAVSAVKGVGSAAVKVVAGMAGSTLGYAAAVAVYKEISTSLKEYEAAKEERVRIEAESREALDLILQYRMEMKEGTERYFQKHLSTFGNAFSEMDQAIIDDDVDGFLSGNAEIQKLLHHDVQFSNQAEFDTLMRSSEDFIL